jgi:hypothetical protein
MSRKSLLRPTALWPQSLPTQIFFCLTYIITMACIRYMYSLIENRTFTLPTQKQHFIFFSAKDMKNGVMDNWIKLVKIKQWQRHDDDDCTVFHFSYKLRKSHGIKNSFNDACISTLIDTTQIGILARLNKTMRSTTLGYPTHLLENQAKSKFDFTKKQSLKCIVDMVAQKIGQSKLSSKQIKHEDIHMVVQKLVKAGFHLSKLNMKTLIPLL